MRLKRVVLVALVTSVSGLVLILLAGLVVPQSVLVKLSGKQSAANSAGHAVLPGTKTATTTNSKGSATTDNSPQNGVATSGAPATHTGGGTAVTGSNTTGTGTAGGTGAGSGSGTGGTGGTGGGTSPPTSISTFTASPSSIAYNGSSTLSWASSNATGCSIAPSIGAVAASGSHGTGALTSSTTYTLTCSGNGSVSRQASVSVGAAPPACGQAGGTCSAAQVAAHNSAGDCWMIYSKKWYVVTSYVNSHPGGRSVFNSTTCGADVTAYLSGSASSAGQRHTHSAAAYSTLQSFTGGAVQ
jgi:hypothetical protein